MVLVHPWKVSFFSLWECGIPPSVGQVGEPKWECCVLVEDKGSEDPNYCELADSTLWGMDVLHMATDGGQWKCGPLGSGGPCMGLQIQVMGWKSK